MEQAPVTTDKKKRQPPEPTLIGLLESGQDMLADLIRKHHHHLASVNILLLNTNKEIKTGGRPRMGKVQKATPLVKYLSSKVGDDGADILITVSQTMWNDAKDIERRAALDHLLTCIEAEEDEESGDLKLKVVAPPVAAFSEIIERYGAFSDELRELKDVLTHVPAVVAPQTR